MGEFIRRHTSPKGVVLVREEPDAVADVYPALAEFLTLTRWEDQSPRDTGTMLICWGEGRWRAWLNDRDSQANSWLSGDTLADLLLSVESGLREGTLEWRGVRPKRPR
jgi:hypothetical protein